MTGMPPTMEFNRPLGSVPVSDFKKIGKGVKNVAQGVSSTVSAYRTLRKETQNEKIQTEFLNRERAARKLRNPNQFKALPAGSSSGSGAIIRQQTSGPAVGSFSPTTREDHLATLGFDRSANPTTKEINSAVRRLAKTHHPDLVKTKAAKQRRADKWLPISAAQSALTGGPKVVQSPSNGSSFTFRDDVRKFRND